MGISSAADVVTVGFVGTFSIWHWLIVLAVVLLLFGGGGKIPKLMKDIGSGVNQFKKGLREEDKKKDGETDTAEAKAIEEEPAVAASSAEKEESGTKAANG